MPLAKLKANCRSYANMLLRRGKLVREPCCACGSIQSQMHHPDYSLPRTYCGCVDLAIWRFIKRRLSPMFTTSRVIARAVIPGAICVPRTTGRKARFYA
jgi:hypothetical protein